MEKTKLIAHDCQFHIEANNIDNKKVFRISIMEIPDKELEEGKPFSPKKQADIHFFDVVHLEHLKESITQLIESNKKGDFDTLTPHQTRILSYRVPEPNVFEYEQH